jgi:hypothetical protein
MPFGIISDLYCLTSAILWLSPLDIKELNFLFFVFVLKSFWFLFLGSSSQNWRRLWRDGQNAWTAE